MELREIYFDAYKSLLGIELELTHSCLGFVGINESGKSNVLEAINTLSPSRPLKHADAPRMLGKPNPYVRFEFAPDDPVRQRIGEILADLAEKSSLDSKVIALDQLTVVYHVLFDKSEQVEKRFFTVEGLQLPAETLLLRADAITDGYLVRRGETLMPLNEALVLTKEELQRNEAMARSSAGLVELEGKIAALKNQIDELETVVPPATNDQITIETQDPASSAESKDSEEPSKGNSEGSPNLELVNLKRELQRHLKTKEKRQAQLADFNIEDCIAQAQDDFERIEKTIEELRSTIRTSEAKVTELQQVESKDEAQVKELNSAKRSVKALANKRIQAESSRRTAQSLLKSLQEPIASKYTSDVNELSRHLGRAAEEELESLLPPVVFWKPSEDYILPGETEFKGMLAAEDLIEISRPLVNLFRISLGTRTLEDLKKKIAEIQNDSSQRSTYEVKLNKKTRKFLKSVWPDYNQEIKISLEQERIRVEFFDPNCDDASHFKMEERSQGCQSFISFLLTIGTEAKQGVITNTVLLLDEPETHLHPSGVRYMLQELIKAAENGNKVLYATHSIFMIDRENYDRHIILTKKNEQTSIQPSRKDRIGFFMQEEVLYSTLDIDLSDEFKSTNMVNFVFEGDADTAMFECFYTKALRDQDRPFQLQETSFYQGGRCSDILKYFRSRPIQLGTTWILVLDNDKPANELREFIKSRYKDFLNKYIFIFQYDWKDLPDKPMELEDLLPEDILSDAIIKSVAYFDDSIASTVVEQMIDVSRPFGETLTLVCDRFGGLRESAGGKGKFKSQFKSMLNSDVATKLETIKSRTDMEQCFPKYTPWAISVVEELAAAKKKPDPAPKPVVAKSAMGKTG